MGSSYTEVNTKVLWKRFKTWEEFSDRFCLFDKDVNFDLDFNETKVYGKTPFVNFTQYYKTLILTKFTTLIFLSLKILHCTNNAMLLVWFYKTYLNNHKKHAFFIKCIDVLIQNTMEAIKPKPNSLSIFILLGEQQLPAFSNNKK